VILKNYQHDNNIMLNFKVQIYIYNFFVKTLKKIP
jgi:hypothetical protein